MSSRETDEALQDFQRLLLPEKNCSVGGGVTKDPSTSGPQQSLAEISGF